MPRRGVVLRCLTMTLHCEAGPLGSGRSHDRRSYARGDHPVIRPGTSASATLSAPMSQPDARPRTLFEKIWDDHDVAEDAGTPTPLGMAPSVVREVRDPH